MINYLRTGFFLKEKEEKEKKAEWFAPYRRHNVGG